MGLIQLFRLPLIIVKTSLVRKDFFLISSPFGHTNFFYSKDPSLCYA